MGQNIRSIMDKFCAFFLKCFTIFQKPPGKHGRKHTVCFRISRLFSPNVQIHCIYRLDIFSRPRIQIINIWSDCIAIPVHTDNTADDTVSHNGLNSFHSKALLPHLLRTLSHARLRQTQIFIHVHFHPSRIRIIKCRRFTG